MHKGSLRIHLSTGLVLMFAASGLLWLNNIHTMIEFRPRNDSIIDDGHGYFSKEKLPEVGWPWVAQKNYYLSSFEGGNYYFYEDDFKALKLALDGICALAILVLIAIVLEWRIRRSATSEP